MHTIIISVFFLLLSVFANAAIDTAHSEVDSNNTSAESVKNFSMMQPSTASFWVGATLAYNFQGLGSEYVVGAAHVKIEELIISGSEHFSLPIVGNFANINSYESDSLKSQFDNIVQSNQGLSIGLMPTYQFSYGFNLFGSASLKINGLKNEKGGQENLLQGRFSLGLENEFLETSKGAPFHIGFEGIYSVFDESVYARTMGEKKSSLISGELTIILPLGERAGFLFTGNYIQGGKPIYQAGIVLGGRSNDDE